MVNLHEYLDEYPGPDPDEGLRRALAAGAGVNVQWGPLLEAPLHVATRRRRLSAVEILLDHRAEIDARNLGGKTAYAHAARRGFDEVAEALARRGANTELLIPDRLAVAFSGGDHAEAERILSEHPYVARTGNPEEDRLLADMAGRMDPRPVMLLIDAGADLVAPGLDTGTPLHQAAWFGEPANARLLIDAGAPLDVFDEIHGSSPIGWAVHGSRYSGGAEERQDRYLALVGTLLEAGSSLRYPDGAKEDGYLARLLADASPGVADLLRRR